MENVAQNLEVAVDGDARVYTHRALENLAKNAVKGSRCPHGRKWALVDWSLRINGGLTMHVNVECPHDLDKQTADFTVAL
jgi:hypothetical protein